MSITKREVTNRKHEWWKLENKDGVVNFIAVKAQEATVGQ